MSQIWESGPKSVTIWSIKGVLSLCREGLPKAGIRVYGVQMPRTDENGRQLKALLDYLLDGEIDAKDIFDALGISSSTYYRRIKEADYPNAEELRSISDRFGLSYPDLQIQFGLMSRQEVWQYIEATGSAPIAVATLPETTVKTEAKRRAKLADLTPRMDAPPL
jgi:hypothetical protein